MKKVIIMRGCPGSGKSTYISSHGGGKVCSADNFFMVNGEYVFNLSKIGEAHASCLRDFVDSIQSGIETIWVDNTNTTNEEVAPYVALSFAYGYDVEFVVFNVNPELAASRNVHNVPGASVARMYKNLQNSLKYIPNFWKCIHTETVV